MRSRLPRRPARPSTALAGLAGLAVLGSLLVGAIPASGSPAPLQAPARSAPAAAAARPAVASPGHLRASFTRVAGGFDTPIAVTSAPGSSRLFVVEQAGRIRTVQGGRVTGTYLDIRSLVLSGGEQGMLGIAFPPDFASSHYFWVTYTRGDGALVLDRFRAASATSSSVSTGTRHTVLVVKHPGHGNHNGGNIGFGPGGYLYLGTGDGGSAGDPPANAPNRKVLLGKILRIDVRCSARTYCIPPSNPYATSKVYRHEIWMYGLRNPWRWSFDTNGAMWIGDVGQDRYEEVDAVPLAKARGANLGWSCREGNHVFNGSRCSATATYWRASYELCHPDNVVGCPSSRSGEAVIGGFVYRGSAYPAARGAYVFADYVTNKAWVVNGGKVGSPVGIAGIAGFGQTQSRELYAVSLGGALYRVGFRSV